MESTLEYTYIDVQVQVVQALPRKTSLNVDVWNENRVNIEGKSRNPSFSLQLKLCYVLQTTPVSSFRGITKFVLRYLLRKVSNFLSTGPARVTSPSTTNAYL